jgi:hypothetical protein
MPLLPHLNLNLDDYPNRESWVWANNSRRRALTALDTLEEHAKTLKRRIVDGYQPYGSDAQRFVDNAIKLCDELSKMELMRDVLEWHAADNAEKEDTP